MTKPNEKTPLRRSEPLTLPLKILQFGEGNFLRAFVDPMIDGLNRQGLFGGSIAIVQPLPEGKCEQINRQDGLFTVVLRGLEAEGPVERRDLIRCVSGCVNPRMQWHETVELACRDTLEFIVSNTTESGIRYAAESWDRDRCPETFPAKITSLLFHRYSRFHGAPDRGLTFLPCELIESNASELKRIVLRYAADWNLEPGFADWVNGHCRFYDTLVDRIVPGFPAEEADRLCDELGYEDRLITVGEWFHLFVIEAPETLDERLPLVRGGFNVVLTDDLRPYRERKVRFLNGTHTASALAGILSGHELVGDLVGDPIFVRFLRQLLFEEIYPTVSLPDEEKKSYAAAILQRFGNPFVKHRLRSIALNSVSKWKVRVLPSLRDYRDLYGKLPPGLTFSLAALIVYYDNRDGIGNDGVRIEDEAEVVRFFEAIWRDFDRHGDFRRLVHGVLERRDWWGSDLNELEETVAKMTERIKTLGAAETLGNEPRPAVADG